MNGFQYKAIENLSEFYDGDHIVEIHFSYQLLTEVLGDPIRNSENDFPLDKHKTDVCWCVKSDEGFYISIWNYKNGPSYTGYGDLSDIALFYSSYSNEVFYNAVYKELDNNLNSKAFFSRFKRYNVLERDKYFAVLDMYRNIEICRCQKSVNTNSEQLSFQIANALNANIVAFSQEVPILENNTIRFISI